MLTPSPFVTVAAPSCFRQLGQEMRGTLYNVSKFIASLARTLTFGSLWLPYSSYAVHYEHWYPYRF